jgi:hypothetical protein
MKDLGDTGRALSALQLAPPLVSRETVE